jgi:hypothetical protein
MKHSNTLTLLGSVKTTTCFVEIVRHAEDRYGPFVLDFAVGDNVTPAYNEDVRARDLLALRVAADASLKNLADWNDVAKWLPGLRRAMDDAFVQAAAVQS